MTTTTRSATAESERPLKPGDHAGFVTGRRRRLVAGVVREVSDPWVVLSVTHAERGSGYRVGDSAMTPLANLSRVEG